MKTIIAAFRVWRTALRLCSLDYDIRGQAERHDCRLGQRLVGADRTARR
ncbi:MAG: hypothetical protein ABII09_07180 [Planctomycetota bacterium]